jgi:hypothetical protein
MRLVLVVLGFAAALAACTAWLPPDPPKVEGGPTIIVDDRFQLQCRGVDEDTCVAIGEAAADKLPAGSTVSRARLAPAQACLGEAPCDGEPPSCNVYASVLFDMQVENELVVNVTGPAEELQVFVWDGPVDAGEHPIKDDVGTICRSLPGVP